MKDVNFFKRTNYKVDDDICDVFMIDEVSEGYDLSCFNPIFPDDMVKHVIVSKDDMKNYLEMCKLDIVREQRKRFIVDRGIDKLFHFTTIEHLESILKNGITCYWSDNDIINSSDRKDNLQDYINTSMSWPNYRLLYSRKMELKDKTFVIVSIDPSIIVDNLDVFFLEDTGSKNSIELEREKNPLFYKSNNGLNNIFKNEVNGVKRSILLSDNMPTSPQAEINIGGIVDPKYIKCIYISKDSLIEDIKKIENLALLYNINYVVDDYYFKPRVDYKSWSKKYKK